LVLGNKSLGIQGRLFVINPGTRAKKKNGKRLQKKNSLNGKFENGIARVHNGLEIAINNE
jgi:hypothetical protein